MRILIIKVGAMGDVLRTTFIAQALKEKYSSQNPKIFWFTDRKVKPLFTNNPYVTEVFDQDNRQKLQKHSFDLVINLEEDKENTKFANSLNTKELIGFTIKDEHVLPTITAKEWYNMSAIGPKPQNDLLKKKNKKTHKQIMSEIVGVDSKKYEPFLRLTKGQRDFAKDFLRRHNLSRSELIIGMNTGAADRWPKALSAKKTAVLIDMLYKKYKAKILLFGGPAEIERNKEIMSLSKSPIITTGCGNDLIEFPALISVCSLFITSDSLGLHIALALKRKTICFVGPTSPTELDMYGLGEKVVAKSRCVACYNHDCKSIQKISVKEIMTAINRNLSQKVTLLITSFKEPMIERAIKSALNQRTRHNYEIVVSAPDKETLDIARKYAKKDKRLKIFKDPGKGKSYALNLFFKKWKTDLLILTDGDVYINKDAIEEMVNLFYDPEIGAATGRPVPVEDKKTKYGYWANFLFYAAHLLRKNASASNSFIECSGYLFAFRKNKIDQIPLDVAEDSVIPYSFWERGYKIGYSDKAHVYVTNVSNWKDWITQKIRTSKAHETLEKYVDTKTTPRVKNFTNEAKGIIWLLSYPKSLKEAFWTMQLAFARLYMWVNVHWDIKLKNKTYQDAWERIESTK
ncbi:glycosyltransferase [Nanoarchaeota archaeon]